MVCHCDVTIFTDILACIFWCYTTTCAACAARLFGCGASFCRVIKVGVPSAIVHSVYSLTMASSVTSVSTRGGCSFEQLCNGSVQSYACDNLIDITTTRDGRTPLIQEAVMMILDHLYRCIQSIEIERGLL